MLSLGSAEADLSAARWRDAALHARSSIENAAKAILGCFASVPKTHEPRDCLEEALRHPSFPPALAARAQAVLPVLSGYGMEDHVRIAEGDEQRQLDPWELVTEDEARRAVETARAMTSLSADVYHLMFGKPPEG